MFMSVAVLLSALVAQSFEAASVKPLPAEGGRFTIAGGPRSTDPRRITYSNIMLRRIMLSAWDVRNYQLSGPDWLTTARFDITATLPEGTTEAEFQAMLRNLLETSFRMKLHRETKEMPIYALAPTKSGLKAGSATADSKDGFPPLDLPAPGLVIETRNGRARITANEVPLSKLADMLSSQLGRPVIDATGMTGNYSFVLYFTPDGQATADSLDPSIFGALQDQLGIRLESRRGPVEMLIVDQADKTPSDN